MRGARHGRIDEGDVYRKPVAQLRQETRRQGGTDDQRARIPGAREQGLTIETQFAALRHITNYRDDNLHATGEIRRILEHARLKETELTGGTHIEPPDFIAGVLQRLRHWQSHRAATSDTHYRALAHIALSAPHRSVLLIVRGKG